jgi:hypothetical protein
MHFKKRKRQGMVASTHISSTQDTEAGRMLSQDQRDPVSKDKKKKQKKTPAVEELVILSTAF